jgi:hypothetical protein
MSRTKLARKRLVKWSEVEAFAAAKGRSLSHVYRVLTRERESKALEVEIEEYFGAPLSRIEFAGRQGASAA